MTRSGSQKKLEEQNPPSVVTHSSRESRMFSAQQLAVRLAGVVGRWQGHSQQHALRNARLASTALARRAVERAEVEEFLATLTEERSAPEAPAAHVPEAAHA